MSPDEPIERRRTLPRGGFSLIELVAVISIAAILAAVAVPAMSGATDARSAAAAAVTLRDLTRARERAIATGVRTWVTFDLGAQGYTISAEDHGAPGRVAAAVLTDLATDRPLGRTFDAGEFVAVRMLAADFDGAPVLGFDWRGSPLGETETPLVARGHLTFTGGHGLTVEPGTGLVATSLP